MAIVSYHRKLLLFNYTSKNKIDPNKLLVLDTGHYTCINKKEPLLKKNNGLN